jgi:hypothetical protein
LKQESKEKLKGKDIYAVVKTRTTVKGKTKPRSSLSQEK